MGKKAKTDTAKTDPVTAAYEGARMPELDPVPFFPQGVGTGLGSPVSLTVWLVTYCFDKPARKGKLPKSVKQDDEKVHNQVVISTADPSGGDNYKVAKFVVLGEQPFEGNNFRVLHYQRMADAMGFAQLEPLEKIAGAAPENTGAQGAEMKDDPEDEDDDGGGSLPPAANLN